MEPPLEGAPRLLSHRLHDIRIEVESHSPRLTRIIEEYLGYLETAWEGEPRVCLSFRAFEAPEGRLAAHPDAPPVGGARVAAGLEIRREGERGYARLPGAASVAADLGTGSADVAFDPAYAGDALLVRDVLSVYLVEMLRGMGRYPLHAAACALEGRGIVVLGPSGAGKSTLALGMARAGLAPLTDDWLLYRETGGGVEAFPLVRSISLPADQVPCPDRYTVLAHHREAPLEKYIVARESLGGSGPPRFRPALVVHATRLAAEVSELREVEPAALLAPALAQSALASADEATVRRQISALRAMLGQARCFELRGGRDIGRDPAYGGRLLRRRLEEV